MILNSLPVGLPVYAALRGKYSRPFRHSEFFAGVRFENVQVILNSLPVGLTFNWEISCSHVHENSTNIYLVKETLLKADCII